ncbi:MAG: HAD-IA family hydrolase [Deltaproteobacteria bacterium]|nr:HAD-IA family hydrolase [Deltaproteobacteria bacterium]
MKIRGVLFDAGNTLIRVRPGVGNVYAAVAARHGVTIDGAALDPLFQAEFRRRRSDFVRDVSRPHSAARERAWWGGLVEAVFRAAGAWEAFEGVFEEFFRELYETFERPEVWEVFPDVEPCLDTLAAGGLRLGVVSNWDSRLHAVLGGLGLARRFDCVLTSAEFGAEKPDPSIFREAALRLGLRPEEVVHVGDLVREDLEGAVSAGMDALLLDRTCGRLPSGPARVCDLREVPARIERPAKR